MRTLFSILLILNTICASLRALNSLHYSYLGGRVSFLIAPSEMLVFQSSFSSWATSCSSLEREEPCLISSRIWLFPSLERPSILERRSLGIFITTSSHVSYDIKRLI